MVALSASTLDAVASSRFTGSSPPGTGSSTTTKLRAAGKETYRSTLTSSPSLRCIGLSSNTQPRPRSTLYSRCTSRPALTDWVCSQVGAQCQVWLVRLVDAAEIAQSVHAEDVFLCIGPVRPILAGLGNRTHQPG